MSTVSILVDQPHIAGVLARSAANRPTRLCRFRCFGVCSFNDAVALSSLYRVHIHTCTINRTCFVCACDLCNGKWQHTLLRPHARFAFGGPQLCVEHPNRFVHALAFACCGMQARTCAVASVISDVHAIVFVVVFLHAGTASTHTRGRI